MQPNQQHILIEQKLQSLRREWTKYPERRTSIELEAGLLKLALNPKKIVLKVKNEPVNNLEHMVTSSLT